MGKIEKNHWFIKEDELSISLIFFHVGIKQIIKEEKDIMYWQITVTDSNMDKLQIGFATLEDCIFFTENYISKSFDFEEIKEKKKEYKKSLKEKGKVKVRHLTKKNK